MPILTESAYDISIPKLIKVKQKFSDEKLESIHECIHEQIQKDKILDKIAKGKKIALAVGSRGIRNIDVIVKCVVDELKLLGAEPFIITAMGSHGGGIAEEQLKILNGYGITEEAMGVEIVSSIITECIGTTNSGISVHIDSSALEADIIVPINRIKPHTDYKGKIESGLCKMMAIGLGNHEGCSRLHKEGFENFHSVIPEVAELILENAPIGFGIAILENAYDQTFLVEAITSEDMMRREAELLIQAKTLMPQILLPNIDVLVVEELGKDITGAGMDPNITGRTARGPMMDFNGPLAKRIIVLGLTKKTKGNATGIGTADYITKDAYEQIHFMSTYANSIASGNPEAARIPVVMDDEKDALVAAINTCTRIDINNAKIVKIKNTLELGEIMISENYFDDNLVSDQIEIVQEL